MSTTSDKPLDGWTMRIADGHRDNIKIINPEGGVQFSGRLADMIERFGEHEKLRYDLRKLLSLSPDADLVEAVKRLVEENHKLRTSAEQAIIERCDAAGYDVRPVFARLSRLAPPAPAVEMSEQPSIEEQPLSEETIQRVAKILKERGFPAYQ